ncbi:MAG: ATP-dependent helicase, partial [Dermatophilaceae bacterium]|nr:ATP-dependent helicase [Dermatophilaceae bacterium]
RLEEQRDHALDRKPNPDDVGQMWAEEQALIDDANRAEQASGALDEGSFEALESDAHFDHVLFDKQQWGMHAQVGSEDEEEYLGLPGLLEPDQVSALLRERQSRQVKKAPQGAQAPTPVAAHRALAAQRKELNKLVSTYARQKGLPHANVHMDLRRVCGGPDLAAATSEQVGERIDKIRLWLVGRR